MPTGSVSEDLVPEGQQGMSPTSAGPPDETPLASDLRRRIARDGPLSVARYMAECLYHPDHGYYTKRQPIGRGGDFVTAPEISQIFGELLGLWAAATWRDFGAPDRVRLVELGPGRGTLMADALRAARLVPGFLAAAEVTLVEISPVLKAVQAETLAAAGAACSWVDSVADLASDGRPILVLANEFFDALPIRQLVRVPGGWRERRIGIDPAGRALRFEVSAETDSALALLPPGLRAASIDLVPEGAVVEINPAAQAMMADLGHRIATNGGAALIMDYGYAPSGPGDTLQALFDGRPSHPLQHPGRSDLTAHVDFAALSEAASMAGCQVHGPLEQGEFLRRLGIEDRLSALYRAAADPATETRLREGVERLIDPQAMGRLFKVLVATAPGTMAIGF